MPPVLWTRSQAKVCACRICKLRLSLERLKRAISRSTRSAHRKFDRGPSVAASFMLTLEKHPAFQARALASLSKNPDIFAFLLAIHVGEVAFLDLFSLRLLNLGLEFLAA